MRFVQFTHKDSDSTKQYLGVQLPNRDVMCLSADPSLPSAMIDFIQNANNISTVQKILKSEDKLVLSESAIDLLAPISKPDKIVCICVNYAEHCVHLNCPIPEEPTIFNKFPSYIIGPYKDEEHCRWCTLHHAVTRVAKMNVHRSCRKQKRASLKHNSSFSSKQPSSP
ncbi:Uncharacterised protein g4077 [Pycnogonum litorale]